MKIEKSWDKPNYYPKDMASIWLTDIRLDDPNAYEHYKSILRYLLIGKKIFFKFSRIDGINLSNEDFAIYEEEILLYFKEQGELIKKNNIGYVEVNIENYDIFPKIFDYYMETICFIPKIEWETFKIECENFPMETGSNYVDKNFTDLTIEHIDSKHLIIIFNSTVYEKEKLYEDIVNMIGTDTIIKTPKSVTKLFTFLKSYHHLGKKHKN